MKVLLLMLAVSLVGFTSCKKCKGEDPTARVVNNGSQGVSVHIATSGGNTININNIDPGQSSNFESYAAGTVTFTITVGNGGTSVDYTSTVPMEECFQYDIILDANNVITTAPTDLNE